MASLFVDDHSVWSHNFILTAGYSIDLCGKGHWKD